MKIKGKKLRYALAAIAALFVFALGYAVLRADIHFGKNEGQEITKKWGFLPLEPKAAPQVRIFMAGDVMLDRDIYSTAQKSGNFAYPFELVDPLMQSFDMAIGNLEGPITSFAPVATPGGALQFTISERFVPELAKRFAAVSLANNHTVDFGQNGLGQTRDALALSGVQAFGDPRINSGEFTVTIRKNGIAIGLVGYHALHKLDAENVATVITDMRTSVDFVIVYPHWGIEYEHSASATQIKEARVFIDAGADLIIGGHPHVVQPMEIYNNKVIFYSVGNFVFDQYWSEETMRSLAVGLELKKTDTGLEQAYQLYPIRITAAGQPELALDADARIILERLYDQSILPESVAESIKANAAFTLR